jgi:hypothetical protein
MVEVAKTPKGSLGPALAEKIRTVSSRKKPHTLEWGYIGLFSLDSGQAKQTPHHPACFLGSQRWENNPFLERLLAAMAHSRPRRMGRPNLRPSHASGTGDGSGLLEGRAARQHLVALDNGQAELAFR